LFFWEQAKKDKLISLDIDVVLDRVLAMLLPGAGEALCLSTVNKAFFSILRRKVSRVDFMNHGKRVGLDGRIACDTGRFVLRVKALNRFPNIMWVDLSCTGVDDDGVRKVVAACGLQLRTLSLSGCRGITHASVFAVAVGCPLLDIFSAAYVDLGGGTGPYQFLLKKLTMLKSLDISGNTLNGGNLQGFLQRRVRGHPSLKQLVLKGVVALSGYPNRTSHAAGAIPRAMVEVTNHRLRYLDITGSVTTGEQIIRISVAARRLAVLRNDSLRGFVPGEDATYRGLRRVSLHASEIRSRFGGRGPWRCTSPSHVPPAFLFVPGDTKERNRFIVRELIAGFLVLISANAKSASLLDVTSGW
jgi:hypothetical protein